MAKKQARAAGMPSLDQLEQAAHAPGSEVASKLRWGWALYSAGRHDEAAAAAREGLGQGSGDAELHFLLGLALKGSGNREGAAKAFHAAAELAQALNDPVRGAMLRRLAVGHANWLERGEWALEPETWVRT